MKYDQVNSLNKKKAMETRKFMYFWLNYSNKNNHLKKIQFVSKILNILFAWQANYMILMSCICFYFQTVPESIIMDN